MAPEPIPNTLAQRVELLLSGYGFNYYRSDNQARSDDLLVREQAAQSLSSAVGTLTELHTTYRLRYLPAPTREQPFPAPDDIRSATDIIALRDRVQRTAAGIRGMSVPTQDKIWRRFRKEQDLLHQLLSIDYLLISECATVSECASRLTADEWHAHGGKPEIVAALRTLETVMRERQQILQVF